MGTLVLGGVYATEDIGTINRQGGMLVLAGDINNNGRTLTSNSSTGSLVLGMAAP